MEIQAPKKEKKFLKSIGRIAGVLAQELVLGLGRKYIGKMINKIKIPKKRETLSFLLLLSCTFAFAQYPATGNKQRLGYQTTGDGLVFRGRSSDTTALKPSTINNAYHLFDTVNNVLFSYIKTKGGWKFNNSDTVIIQGATMPFDSITFNTAKDGTVGVGEVEYNDSQGSLIQGLKGGNVTNIIGQQLHQRVSNVTGSTLSKGTAVYLSGSQGNRITAAKALATSDPTSANTFGIVAESIADNASGYVITEGLITGINTSGLTEDSAVYLSPTVAGGLTSTKPQAPNHGVYIGVCVKTNSGSGELFVKIKNGLELDELHDVLITSPASSASLYYKSSEGIWRDTTASLLVSDTASMLTNYLRSGVAASTYQPLLSGTTNYLPKFTGTSTLGNSSLFDNGNIGLGTGSPTSFLDIRKSSSDNNFTDTLLNINYTFSGIPASQNVTGLNLFVNTNQQNSYGIISETSTNAATAISLKGKVTQSDVNGIGIAYGVFGEAAASGSGTLGSTYAGYFTNTSTVGGNHYGLYVSTASGGDYGIYQTGTGTNYFGSNSTFAGNITGNSIIKSGGTSSQFLKADGSVDASTYLTSSTGVTTFSAGTTGFTPSSATSGAVTLAGTLAIANGGTGATSASAARTALGATVRGANTFTLSDIGAISFLRYNADNTVSQRAADGMRTDLGGSTVGQNMFTLTNPSAITFPRFNADNTVSALDAATFRTAIGAGTGNGNGTVTSVTGTAPIVSSGGTTPAISVNAATSSASGVVSATTQTFGGNKTFNNDVTVSGALGVTGFSTLTGGVSIGSMATTSSLTHVIGVNSSNAIGEIGVTDGLKFSSGFLGMDTYKTIAIMDFPNTSAQSSSDLTATVTGAIAGTPVLLGVPNGSVISNTSYSAWVSSANTVTVRFNNYSASSANPASGSFYLIVLNL